MNLTQKELRVMLSTTFDHPRHNLVLYFAGQYHRANLFKGPKARRAVLRAAKAEGVLDAVMAAVTGDPLERKTESSTGDFARAKSGESDE